MRFKTDAHHTKPGQPLEEETDVVTRDQAAGDPPSLRDGTGTQRRPFEAAAVLLLVAMLEPKLAALLRPLVWIGEAVFADGLRRPLSAGAVRSELLRDTREKDADGGEPLLPVHDPMSRHHARCSGLRKSEQGAAIVGCIGIGSRHGEEIIHQPFDVGLPPAVPALPTGNDELDLCVQEFEKLGGLGMHDVALCCASRRSMSVPARDSPSLGGYVLFDIGWAARSAESLHGRVTTPRKAGCRESQPPC